jgi:hypothetical protein
MQDPEQILVSKLEVFSEKFKKDAATQHYKELLQPKAIEAGSKLAKDSGMKQNSLYFVCHKFGEYKRKEGEGKRNKKSKKCGNNFLVF